MKAKKFDNSGKEQGEIELPSAVFGAEPSKGAMHDVLRAELRNRRQGTHKTKTISEISGGGKKPYRQKGTGNARQGSTRATQFRGGQTVFGPLPRDYRIKVSPKKRKAGIRSIFSTKAAGDTISVLADVTLDKYSTGDVFKIFKTMGLTAKKNRVAYIIDGEEGESKPLEILKKSVANIPGIEIIHAKRITVPELYYSNHVVISESALTTLTNLYTKPEKAGAAG